ncbi:MAG: hypothetical protein AAGD25_30000 [Cyanobacteria bacterium P01_F01_bin.150]
MIDVGYGDGRWFGVFGNDEDRNAWTHASDFDGFKQQINDKWDEGYELVDIGYGDGRWFGVFARLTIANIAVATLIRTLLVPRARGTKSVHCPH